MVVKRNTLTSKYGLKRVYLRAYAQFMHKSDMDGYVIGSADISNEIGCCQIIIEETPPDDGRVSSLFPYATKTLRDDFRYNEFCSLL